MPKVTISNHQISIDFNPGYNLLHNFLNLGAPIHTVCGGNANCGCCRIKILDGSKGMTPPNSMEIRRLGRELIDKGWRLSCQSHSLRDITAHMPTTEELDGRCSPKSAVNKKST